MSKKMGFEKYLFKTALFGWSLAKYSDGESVRIVAEHENGEIGESASFSSVDEYEAWIDSIVDDKTAIYNGAESVRLVLEELEQSTLRGRGGAGRGQGRKVSEDPRSIRKQLRWTEAEWNLVETIAGKKNLSVADFQRSAILGKCN